MFAEVRLRTGTNWATYSIVDQKKVQALSFDTKYSDVGAITIAGTVEDFTALSIGNQTVLEVAPNGLNNVPNVWYCLDGSSGTYLSDDARIITRTGKSLIQLLTDAVVYPSAAGTPDSNGVITPIPKGQLAALAGHSFQNATPGTILKTLFARAQTRGGLLWLDTSSFTGTTDSLGNPFTSTLTITYPNGNSYLQVLQDLVSRGLVSFRMVGTAIQVFDRDSSVTHFTQDQLTVRRSVSLTEQTSNEDSSQWVGTVLLQGDNNLCVEFTNSTTQTTIGRRREFYVSNGGITDGPTLHILAVQQQTLNGHVKNEESLSIPDTMKPWISFFPGDWAWEDKGSGIAPVNLQVKQIAATKADEGNFSIGLMLGDLLDNQDVRIQRQIDNMLGQNSGSQGPLPATPTDVTVPSPPTGVTQAPTPYIDANGVALDQVTVSWSAPTTNVDGSAITDLDHYEVQTVVTHPAPGTLTQPDPDTGGWSNGATVAGYSVVTPFNNITTPIAYVSGLLPGDQLAVRVRTVDSSGHASSWAYATPVKLPNVTVAPPTPSTPTVTSGIQQLRISWNGLDNTGSAMPANWLRTDVHVSTTNGFTPSTATLVGNFSTRGGFMYFATSSYGTTFYVKLVAITMQGQAGPASVQATGSPNQLSDPDLPAQLITGAKVAQGTLNVSNLTVAAFGDSVVPNGGLEDVNLVTTDNVGAAGWQQVTGTPTRNTGQQAEGQACLQLDSNGSTTSVARNRLFFPASSPDVYYFTAKVKASRALTQVGTLLDCYLELSLNGSFTDIATTVDITTNAVGTSYTTLEGQLVIPPGVAYARLAIKLFAPGDAAAITVYLDSISVRPVVGTAWIANASINDAKISDVSANKITTGVLQATTTIIAGVAGGPSVELDSTGLTAYAPPTTSPYDNPTAHLSSADGSIQITGSGSFTGDVSDSSIGNSTILNSILEGTDLLADELGGQLLVYAPVTPIITTFTATGAQTWTCPAGVTSVKVECWGAGAGGGDGAPGGVFGSRPGAGGGGGAGGEYAREDTIAVTPSTVYNLNVGSGGAHAANGGLSSFTGDSKTVTAHGGTKGQNGTAPGGSGSTNALHFSGGSGLYSGGTNQAGSGGASSAGTSGSGNSGHLSSGTTAGNGGVAPTGGAAGGTGGFPNATGSAGSAPGGGAGGGGGGPSTGGGGANGGAGARGQVRLTYNLSKPLQASASAVAGTDTLGNSFPAGVSVFGNALTDWNSIAAPGFYADAGTATNSPVSGRAYSGYAFARVGDPGGTLTVLAVRLTSLDAPEVWTRTFSTANGWRAWRALAIGLASSTYTSLVGSLNAGFSANSFGYTPGYSVQGNKVYLQGGIQKNSGSFATGGVAIATVPAAVRPASVVELVVAITNNTTATTARLEINTAGVMTLFVPGAVGTWFSLDGLSYDLS